MTIDRHHLDLLVCPVTRQPLRVLSEDKLGQLNERIRAGGVKTADGEGITEPWKGALITANGTTLYRVEEGIPLLHEDQAVYVDVHDLFGMS